MADSSATVVPSPADAALCIPHIREAIFGYHCELALSLIPQPEDLPPTDRLLTVDDQDTYLSQLETFLAFHGYKPTSFGEWLDLNPSEVSSRLRGVRDAQNAARDPEDPHPSLDINGWMFGSRVENKETLMRRIDFLIREFDLLTLGLMDGVMIDVVHRPYGDSQLFAALYMPRDSAAGKSWQKLWAALCQHKQLPGILPIEDLLTYGKRSQILMTPLPHPSILCDALDRPQPPLEPQRLERLADAFSGLATLHSLGISVNLWPQHISQFSVYAYTQALPAASVAKENPCSWRGPTAFEGTASVAYAPIAARPWRRLCRTYLPEEPATRYTDGETAADSWALVDPWCASVANEDPRISGPQLHLYNLTWSSSSDNIEETFPDGCRVLPDWEYYLDQNDASLGDFPEGTFREGRWTLETTWPLNCPEQRAFAAERVQDDTDQSLTETRASDADSAHEDAASSASSTHGSSLTPAGKLLDGSEPVQTLPFDRFRRDVYELATRFLSSPDWNLMRWDGVHWLEDESMSMGYEEVLTTKRDTAVSNGSPYGDGLWKFDQSDGRGVSAPPPGDLRRLFLRLIGKDPARRPSAAEAAEAFSTIRDREVPRLHALFSDIGASQCHPLPRQFSREEDEVYWREICAMDPPLPRWAEEAMYRHRQRHGLSDPMDDLVANNASREELTTGETMLNPS